MNKPNHNTLGLFTRMAQVLGTCIILAGCATTEQPNQSSNNPIDPYENLNRKVYGFNDQVDTYVAKPIAETYNNIAPQFLRTGVSNFFTNLRNINVVLNDVLQSKFDQGLQDSGRFLVNTTVGVGGLFDVAKDFGLQQHDEDFDQTLAVWGVPQGTYLVLPLLGPITTRGIPGAVFDTAANPANYVGAPIQLVSMLNARANAEGSLKFVDEAALDRYAFTRDSFLQWRKSLANDGKIDASDDLAFEEDVGIADKSTTTAPPAAAAAQSNVVNTAGQATDKK
jgi:phospholipid-binding lipoprotein MlaA